MAATYTLKSEIPQLNVEFYQGSTFDHTAKLTDANAVPIDITGCKARMHVRSSVTAVDTLVELTDDNGRVILGGTAGTIRLLLTAADTAAFEWTRGVQDFEIEYPDGTVKVLWEGKARVYKAVTR